jgi:hypothetical protein
MLDKWDCKTIEISILELPYTHYVGSTSVHQPVLLAYSSDCVPFARVIIPLAEMRVRQMHCDNEASPFAAFRPQPFPCTANHSAKPHAGIRGLVKILSVKWYEIQLRLVRGSTCNSIGISANCSLWLNSHAHDTPKAQTLPYVFDGLSSRVYLSHLFKCKCNVKAWNKHLIKCSIRSLPDSTSFRPKLEIQHGPARFCQANKENEKSFHFSSLRIIWYVPYCFPTHCFIDFNIYSVWCEVQLPTSNIELCRT